MIKYYLTYLVCVAVGYWLMPNGDYLQSVLSCVALMCAGALVHREFFCPK